MDANSERIHGRPTIRQAVDHAEKEQLFCFRYRIYVEEMQRKQKYADHSTKQIRDPLDDFATNFVAWDLSGQVVGTVRGNAARHGDLLGYDTFYDMGSVGDQHPIATSICTRFMIAPEYRSTLLAVRLCLALYEFGLSHGITYNFMDCNDHLVTFFEGLGYIQHLPKQDHEEYGAVTCMRLNLLNLSHLKQVSSPFVGPLCRWNQQKQQSSLGAEFPVPGT